MILEQCKGVHCVDLDESFQTHIYLQNFVSIQPRTSPVKFAASWAARLQALGALAGDVAPDLARGTCSRQILQICKIWQPVSSTNENLSRVLIARRKVVLSAIQSCQFVSFFQSG